MTASVIADAPAVRPRFLALDVFRGLVMMTLAFQGFLPGIALAFPESPALQFLGHQFEHVDWQGGVLWDLIMPSFIFMVGMAMTFSVASRRASGKSTLQVTWHVLYRSVVLILLGVILVSAHTVIKTTWVFGEVLTQMGFAFPIVYLLAKKSERTQWTAFALILVGTWLLFFLYPAPGQNFDYAALGLTPQGPYTGLFAHWNKGTNLAYAFDRWFLNLFPRDTPFTGNENYGPTLNFIPSIATMLLGVIVGGWLRQDRPATEKMRRLVVAGVVGILGGLLLGATLCPIIKNLWTPSYVIWSGGIVCLLMAACYWVSEGRTKEGWLFPLIVVGRNSLVMYLMLRLFREPLRATVAVHAYPLRNVSHYWTLEYLTVVLLLWLICYWLYRRKIFISI